MTDQIDWERKNSPLRRFLRRMIGFPALADGTPLPCSACGSRETGHDCGNGMLVAEAVHQGVSLNNLCVSLLAGGIHFKLPKGRK